MTEDQFSHLPVMAREVVDLFLPVPAGLLIDCTVGAGGHAALLLDARPDCRLLGIDRDADAVAAATARLRRFGDRVEMVQGEFGQLRSLVGRREEAIVGVLMDLGVSSPQLDHPERGFSYRFDVPLDMRMDARQQLTAWQVVNEYDEDELAGVIATFGEERYARRVAHAIAERRPIDTTKQLVDAITTAIPAASRRTGGHPARRTFQAIRMEVNRELPNLADGLDESVHLVGTGGRILVLAYHSLEDRIVKERMREWADEEPESHEESRLPVARERHPIARILTRRPLRPAADEVRDNPRSESARLRACERLEGEFERAGKKVS
jgi:16S rRNA (cytosine1402-N4)-methyltransferase